MGKYVLAGNRKVDLSQVEREMTKYVTISKDALQQARALCLNGFTW